MLAKYIDLEVSIPDRVATYSVYGTRMSGNTSGGKRYPHVQLAEALPLQKSPSQIPSFDFLVVLHCRRLLLVAALA
jgi:hypothetical protein